MHAQLPLYAGLKDIWTSWINGSPFLTSTRFLDKKRQHAWKVRGSEPVEVKFIFTHLFSGKDEFD